MKHTLSLLALLLACSIATAQFKVTLEVNVPPNPNEPYDALYLAGSLNNYNPADSAYQLKKISATKYQISFTSKQAIVSFKITRGNWATVETGANGSFCNDHAFDLRKDTNLKLTVADWADRYKSSKKHTRSPNVIEWPADSVVAQFGFNRRIWIYLPPDYKTSDKKYPVIYLFDGQNLFDEFTAYEQEWRIDESLDSLAKAGKQAFIVVGIDNAGKKRTDEYTAFPHPQYGGGKMRSLTDALRYRIKPYIDKHYRTLEGVNHTYAGGSSLGALAAFSVGMQFPHVFGRLILFSPSWWWSNKYYELAKSSAGTGQLRIYMLAGALESEELPNQCQQMYDALRQKGSASPLVQLVIKPDGLHKEWFWAREFPEALQWLQRPQQARRH